MPGTSALVNIESDSRPIGESSESSPLRAMFTRIFVLFPVRMEHQSDKTGRWTRSGAEGYVLTPFPVHVLLSSASSGGKPREYDHLGSCHPL